MGKCWSQSFICEISLESPVLPPGEGDPKGVLGVLKE